MVDEKYIGMALAMSSSLLIGTSFVLTKKGLNETTSRYGSATEGLQYFKNVMWWAGMITMGLGEVANFAAYSFAPAILVTPLGALSVIVGAVLASIFLGEKINMIGKAGCALCLMGSVVVVLNAPRDGDIESVEQIMHMVVQIPFLTYALTSVTFLVFMVLKVAGRYGQRTPVVYVSICSVAGSLTVTACKAFGIALKLTFAGNNQFVHVSTYFFAAVVVACIMVQMNYFNKALEQFDTNLVTPIYYVFFTSATILASVALFQGFTDSTNKELASLFCGFMTIFIGVFLLNSTKGDAAAHGGCSNGHQPLPTDEPERLSYDTHGRLSHSGAAAYNIPDFECGSDEGGDIHINDESYPLRERGNTIDSEKGHTLNRRHTFTKTRATDTIDLSEDDGSPSTSSSRSNYGAPVSPASMSNDGSLEELRHGHHNTTSLGDVQIDIPGPPASAHRRKSLAFCP